EHHREADHQQTEMAKARRGHRASRGLAERASIANRRPLSKCNCRSSLLSSNTRQAAVAPDMIASLRPGLVPLGKRIQQARRGAHLTQSQVGRALGVSKQQVSHWETGRSDLTREHLLHLAKLFKVETDWLARGSMIETAAAVSAATPAVPADGLIALGQKAPTPLSPATALIERVPNPHPDTHYLARFT